MPANYIETAFPRLGPSNYSIESPTDSRYNCIAWAVGDDTRWWEPSGLGGHYWPLSPLPAPAGYTLSEYMKAYSTLGFEPCTSRAVERDLEKVALYVDPVAGSALHAARQLADGRWASKLGQGHDIFHETLEGLEGERYGVVAVIMQRRR